MIQNPYTQGYDEPDAGTIVERQRRHIKDLLVYIEHLHKRLEKQRREIDLLEESDS